MSNQNRQDLVILIEHPNFDPYDFKRINNCLRELGDSNPKVAMRYDISNYRSIFCFQRVGDSYYFGALLDPKFTPTYYPLQTYLSLVEIDFSNSKN